ncbi:MAG: elongation factor P lysine(34) lysyltransferase [SAR86 cluster bacterium]|uniref:Elongation factor P lysine(34) lysyltransferase n=1 Tax=SAR86 cluster bacterium TaxID=2030880 RepID=A0A2A5AC97_9GAMM|nr:MAG: elongation factor P lysine(34) lysyltransferase [SAR86 cluster bacterium]
MVDWKPSASIKVLQQRSEILSNIRRFFAQKNVLEVETPLLAHSTATDVHIQSLSVENSASTKSETLFLQTSPEFAMKRLLGAGVGPIFQICKAFRQDESSKQHNPEFTMLEWYQPGYSMMDLIDEVEQLIQSLINCGSIPRLSYRDIFLEYFDIDPHNISLEDLKSLTNERMDINSDDLNKTDYLQLLLGKFIEPKMPDYCFVFDFPIDQAALAVIAKDEQGIPVAKRFELFCKGMELANGYFELLDPVEQLKRFEADIDKRNERGLPDYAPDEKLIAAMESGIPPCAGVALGIDRLLMLLSGSDNISDVISFTTDRA